MRKFNVKVNGVQYLVEVEETTDGAQVSSQTVTAPVAAPVQPKPVNVGAGEPVKAPMPGTVLKLMAENGTAVKRGQVLFVLEAMKMENDIVAPKDGTFKSVVAKGASVNTGDVLGTVE